MEMMEKYLQAIHEFSHWTNDRGSYNRGDLPFIDYILEDKSKYKPLSDFINPNTNSNWVDKDGDFLMGDSGGVLMKMDFVFIGTEIFSRTATFFEKYKEYTLHPKGSPERTKFWATEKDRRLRGVEAKCKLYYKDIPKYLACKTDSERKALLRPLRITGDHYNYLNYGRIKRVPNEEERRQLDKEGKLDVQTIDGFPRFWDGDYWNYKIDELASLNKYNLTKAKARRKGFSYKAAAGAANKLNTIKNIAITFVAKDLKDLIDPDNTSSMSKTCLDWYESYTDWKRGYLSEDLEKGLELGYKKKKEGNKKYGMRSILYSIPVGLKPDKAASKKSYITEFEEAGKNDNLQRALDFMKSNSESGGIRVGNIRVYGTSGVEGAIWEPFRNCFYNCAANNMLPLENIWDRGKRHTTCGFFFPQIWCYEPYIIDGNSIIFESYIEDFIDKESAKENSDSESYTTFVAQRANTPAEAFMNTNDNLFNSFELENHTNMLLNDGSYKFYQDGWYVIKDGSVRFLNKQECINNNVFGNNKFHDYILDVPHTNKTDVHGCVREFYPPIPNATEDDYFISCDTYRVDKRKKFITSKHSLYGFQVWMKINNKNNNYSSKRLVASYTGRLDSMEENDRLLLYACLRYNCKVLVEAGTGEVVTNFKKWGYRDKLLKDPSYYLNRSLNQAYANNYGIVIGDGETKLEGLRMLRDFLYEVVGYKEDNSPTYRFEECYDVAFLLECLRFDLEKNFDRISTAIVAMYEFKKLSILLEREVKNKNKDGNKRLMNRILL